MPRASSGRASSRVVRGDWQTPQVLALRLTRLLADRIPAPRTVIEPTCGRGAFLSAAATVWPNSRRFGLEVDAAYCAEARTRLGDLARIECGDVFGWDWTHAVEQAEAPVLFLGNPPWVTVDALGRRGADNRPPRKRSADQTALESVTGGGNFDVSEWVLTQLSARAAIAMLCKTRVARSLIQQRPDLGGWVWEVDAREHFGASVSCVFIASGGLPGTWLWHPVSEDEPAREVAVLGGQVVHDRTRWKRTEHLSGEGLGWRSGVKHDCARVMELQADGDRWTSGVEAGLDLEDAAVFPLLKGGDLDRGVWPPHRGLLVTQHHTGEEPQARLGSCPRAWAYLQRHSALLHRRRSRIYKGRPFGSMFGVGPYSFAPWKVAVSALSKHRRFQCIGPVNGRPVVFDDTCLFASFDDEGSARKAHRFLCSEPVADWLRARTSPDAKRTLTARLLRTLSMSEG